MPGSHSVRPGLSHRPPGPLPSRRQRPSVPSTPLYASRQKSDGGSLYAVYRCFNTERLERKPGRELRHFPRCCQERELCLCCLPSQSSATESLPVLLYHVMNRMPPQMVNEPLSERCLLFARPGLSLHRLSCPSAYALAEFFLRALPRPAPVVGFNGGVTAPSSSVCLILSLSARCPFISRLFPAAPRPRTLRPAFLPGVSLFACAASERIAGGRRAHCCRYLRCEVGSLCSYLRRAHHALFGLTVVVVCPAALSFRHREQVRLFRARRLFALPSSEYEKRR